MGNIQEERRIYRKREKTFNIPVYQRNYDWKEEQCKRLFGDI